LGLSWLPYQKKLLESQARLPVWKRNKKFGRKQAYAIISRSKTIASEIVNTIKNNLRIFQRRVLDGIVRHVAHGALEVRAERIVQLFENQIPRKSRILDLGGGWGFYAGPLKTRGHEHLVLDVVDPGYKKSPVVLYDGLKIPFPDQSFDVTILMTMLHHVPDPQALFEEVRRVTRQKVVVVEDLYHHTVGRLWTICRDRILNVEFMAHPHQFRKDGGWREFFKMAGFEVSSFKSFYTWLSGMRILNGIYVLEKNSG
jgi:SAM-dependent methyltransferase